MCVSYMSVCVCTHKYTYICIYTHHVYMADYSGSKGQRSKGQHGHIN